MNKNELEIRSLTAELRAAPDPESRTIEGYAAKFNSWSQPLFGWFVERIAPEAFEGCDMSDVIMCMNHDPSQLLSRTSSGTLDLKVDGTGLGFLFDSPETTLGNDVLVQMRRGDISQCSFRFCVEADEWVYADKDNGLEYSQRTITKISVLRDVSLVTFPAYKDTEASVRHLEERKAQADQHKSQGEKIDTSHRDRELELLTI